MVQQLPLEETLDQPSQNPLSPEDKALARAIASTTLRHLGRIDKVLNKLMSKSPGNRGGDALNIMRLTAAQILFMNVPDHASVSLAAELAKKDHKAKHFVKLINGVLRSLSREKGACLDSLTFADNLPDWVRKTWETAYGAGTTEEMAKALANEPYLDIATKSDGSELVQQLGGVLLKNGTIRLTHRGAVPDLPGFKQGDWWVQDAAAQLVPSLLSDVKNQKIADLCAAPGGKTLCLARDGANVTAVDVSIKRLERLKENLNRVQLDAEIVATDIVEWETEQVFDALILDAPCSATGTARKHPDVLWLKTPDQPQKLAKLQTSLMKKAASLLKPGGKMIYATCSLQPEEGEALLQKVDLSNINLSIDPISNDEVFDLAGSVSKSGTIRILPHHNLQATAGDVSNRPSGMDGFFMARLVKTS